MSNFSKAYSGSLWLDKFLINKFFSPICPEEFLVYEPISLDNLIFEYSNLKHISNDDQQMRIILNITMTY